eukprot:359062-Chlamydomonas_euryale.AAC.11
MERPYVSQLGHPKTNNPLYVLARRRGLGTEALSRFDSARCNTHIPAWLQTAPAAAASAAEAEGSSALSLTI